MPSSDRITVRRGAEHALYEGAEILRILEDGLIAHVAAQTKDGPLVLPMAYGVHENVMYLHGALANALLKSSTDSEICATVTIVDGLVLAKTAFNHSMNYRSVVIRGSGRVVTDRHEQMVALRAITDHVAPLWDTTRELTENEIRATRVVALPLTEMSAKIRSGGATNDPEDADIPFWSGHVPITSRFGDPIQNSDALGEMPAVVARLSGLDAYNRQER